MKNTVRQIIALLLVVALVGSLTACGDSFKIHIDSSGLASWKPVKGAVSYDYTIMDAEHASLGEKTTTQTQVQLPEGRAIAVRAVFANGETGSWMVSDFYGEPSFWDHTKQEISIFLDENGYAVWEPVADATEYRCSFLDGYGTCIEEVTVTDPKVRVPLKCQLEVLPLMADGSEGMRLYSDYHQGELYSHVADGEDLIDFHFNAKASECKTYEVIANIDYSTVQTAADGTVTFTATGPNGAPMRFSGTGISVAEGAITFEPSSTLHALDAIGRICAYKPVVSDIGDTGTSVEFRGGYTFNDQTSVASVEDLFKVWPTGVETFVTLDAGYYFSSVMEKQPNMIGIGASDYNTDTFTLSELVVFYDETTYTTNVSTMHLDYYFYGTYLEGDLYDPSREIYDPVNRIYTFYLQIIPQLQNEVEPPTVDYLVNPDPYATRAVIDIPMERYEIGELKDPNGNIMNKQTDPLVPGCTLEIIMAGQTYDLELPIIERSSGVQTLHELTPYGNIPSIGEVTPLVVPVQWSDYADPDPAGRLDMIRERLGRIVDESGRVTDYSTDIHSLSAYYDAVSLGNYHIESFLTDWVTVPYTVEEGTNLDMLSHSLPDEIYATVQQMHPNMDWSQFDRNADGIVDMVIYISAAPESDVLNIMSFIGGAHNRRGYDGGRAGTPEKPNLKDFICVGTGVLDADEHVILHEYGHGFGLIDYYDVTYQGGDAVGQFDMQSGSYGDWNGYSKYSVGWIEPEVVTGLAGGESVEIIIGSMAETGDAIVIPAAGADFDGPFGEYMLVDLFTATGVNETDASKHFKLADEVGVRIYHINANMEHRTLINKYGDETVIGTVNIANDYKDSGKYHIELLQRGGDNTFTDLLNTRAQFAPQDLFRTSDVFTAERYSEFLTDGRMDNGSEFGYTIEIVSIEENGADSTATIRITRN